jgi:hypothetical protein
MGAKIWWCWLKYPTELWAKLWKKKYAPNINEAQLIRFNDQIQGSNIWNAAWRNHPLIRNMHSGKSGMDKNSILDGLMATVTSFAILGQHAPHPEPHATTGAPQGKGPLVKCFTSSPLVDLENSSHDLNIPVDCDLQPWHTITIPEKDSHQGRTNILHWGHSPLGTFTIKEAYILQENFHVQPKENIWNIIWRSRLWPKVSTFLWLMVQINSHLGQSQEKRVHWTLDLSSLSATGRVNGAYIQSMLHLWGDLGSGFSDYEEDQQERDNIISTIENWGTVAFKNPILNRIWQLLPGFVVWQIWKERNMHIFTPKPLPLPTSGQRFMEIYRKPYVPNIGPRKTSRVIPKKASSFQTGS